MNDINNDTNLREAVSRREQQLPPMSADLNIRLMQRLQERQLSDSTPEVPLSRNRRIRFYIAIAASVLLIIGIGTVLFTDKPTDNSLYTSHQGETLYTSDQTLYTSRQEETLYTSDQTLYTSRQMETQQKPERLKRRRWCVPIVQAGVKPLQKQMVTLAPKGRQNALPPLQGLATPRLFTRISPLPVVSTPLRGYNELPDTLGDGIWQSKRNVIRAMQMLAECETTIEKGEQEMRNTIIEATFNATPQPANAVLVTNEAGDCEVIETKTIIEI